MLGFQTDFRTFPQILKGDLSKRQIAERASSAPSLKLAKEAYRVRPGDMAPLAALYVVSPEGEQVSKIGIAINPFDRLKYLQGGCWLKLHIKALFWFTDISNAASLEYASLQLAKQERVRLQGEWVDLSHLEAVGLILTAARIEHRVFTDSHGLVFDWFAEIQRQKLAEEDDYYSRIPTLPKAITA